MNRFVIFLKSRDLYLGICRYILGLMMIPYAVSKILRLQFVVLPVHAWQQSLESFSGRLLAWSFLSYSPWFQVLLGFLELIPALFLLFRRTTLIGAILMLPMTLNVFLVNMAYNLWDGTKQISLVLLILNFIVLMFEWENIKSLLLIIFYKERKFRFRIWEWSINFIVIAAAIILPALTLIDYSHQTNELTGDWYNKHPIEWILTSEKVNDSILPTRMLKCYFGAYGSYEEVVDTGFKRQTVNYILNKEKGTLQFNNDRDSSSIIFNYQLARDTSLVLQRTIDSSKKVELTQVFRKRIINGKKY